MKKVISFSLFGSDEKYLIGSIRNAQLARDFFPDWQTSFFVSEAVPGSTLERLEELADKVTLKPEPGNLSGMFWRFQEGTNPENTKVIFRDVDSRLSIRDAKAVDDWVNSGKSLHIVRDHPMHNAPILGGLWGVTPSAIPELKLELENYTPAGYYGEDQEFLWKRVYKPLKNDRYIHDAFFLREIRKERINQNRMNYEFLGESVSADESIDLNTRYQIREFEQNKMLQRQLKIKSLIMKVVGR